MTPRRTHNHGLRSPDPSQPQERIQEYRAEDREGEIACTRQCTQTRPEGPHPLARLDPRRSPATARQNPAADRRIAAEQSGRARPGLPGGTAHPGHRTRRTPRDGPHEPAHPRRRTRARPGSQPPAARGHSGAGPQAALHRRGRRGQVPQAAALGRRPQAAGRQARGQRRGLPLAAGAVGRIPHPAGPRLSLGHAGLAPLHPPARQDMWPSRCTTRR